MSTRVATVQRSGPPGRKNQPASSSANVDISIRLRRKLSRIFQREITLSGFGVILPK